MAGNRGHVIDEDWLRAHYPTMTDINHLLDEFEARFGWRPNKTHMYNKANRLGIRKKPIEGRGNRCERPVYWSKEPEMEAWMLEHDKGQMLDVLSQEFRERFGFGLSRAQISLFRASHGTQFRRNICKGGKNRVPLFTERVGKDGYLIIKVREDPIVPMSKDNWEMKHVWVYKQTHGEVPEGCKIYFADKDRRNFDPDNLVAVPNNLVGILNNPSSPRWYDRKSLLACIALAKLKADIRTREFSIPRVCSVCGKTFVPIGSRRIGIMVPPKTCPECVAKGHKAHRINHAEVLRLHELGLSNSEIAQRMKCSDHQVGLIIRKESA